MTGGPRAWEPGLTSGDAPLRRTRWWPIIRHTCRLWVPRTYCRTGSRPCWLARAGSAWGCMPSDEAAPPLCGRSARPYAPLQRLGGRQIRQTPARPLGGSSTSLSWSRGQPEGLRSDWPPSTPTRCGSWVPSDRRRQTSAPPPPAA